MLLLRAAFAEVRLQTFDFCFPAAVSVEPTYSYYEKVSQELERIVHEVQENEEVEPLTDGEKPFFESLKCFN